MAGKDRFVELDPTAWANFKSQVKQLSADAKKELKELHEKKAEELAPVASVMAPYESGRLARSVKAGATTTGGQIKAGGSSVQYAAPIHWGWPKRNIRPQRFIVWALGRVSRDSKGGYEGEYLEAMLDLVKKHLEAETISE